MFLSHDFLFIVFDGSEETDPDRPGIDNPVFFKDDSKTGEMKET